MTTNPVFTDEADQPMAVSPAPIRSLVAAITLATHLPMPTRIAFQGEGAGQPGVSILSLRLRSVADGPLWSSYLGGTTNTRVHSGRTWLDEGVIRWRGWSVHLEACDDPTRDSYHMGGHITEALTALAGGESR